jgi:hypothetical protein
VNDPHTPPATDSTAFGRSRDTRVVWLLGRHPVTAATLVALGWFPTRAKALRRLGRLVARGRIRLVGTVCRKAGRPEHVYCRWRPKADQLLHEVELTELCLRIDAAEVRRGPHATDAWVRPDAEVTIGGRPFYVELDRDTMGHAQLARRFRLYEDVPHHVLWVCPTVARRDALRARAAALRHTALFATLSDALADPHAPVWMDHAGGRAALPREPVGEP